jgi:hypothetical protein
MTAERRAWYDRCVAPAFDLATLLAQVQSFSEDVFCMNWPGHFLLTAPNQRPTAMRFITEPAERRPTQVTTPTRMRFEVQRLGKSGPSQPASTTRISVGRASTCDIVLRHPSVSKLHASFRLDADYVGILDNGSRNGTAVNDEPLIPEKRIQVHSRDRIRLGALETVLFDAEGLYQFLHV